MSTIVNYDLKDIAWVVAAIGFSVFLQLAMFVQTGKNNSLDKCAPEGSSPEQALACTQAIYGPHYKTKDPSK